jgi:cell fate (sporulation/competence/biofilm development) regulator YlbF (YheA/YmcA/DUF963 family)
MPNENEPSAVTEKTRELCQAILQQPEIISAQGHISVFMSNPQAQADYQALVTKGQALQEKQEKSIPLTDEEIAEFESHREKVLGNPVSRAFLDAQQSMQQMRHSVNKFVSMALESGRVPTEQDFESASCGHGCNCH